MSVGRVVEVYRNRLACTVSSTVVGDGTTKVIPVDSGVVDFNEDGGEIFHHQGGNVYDYATVDSDAETLTLSAGLPVGRTLTAGDTLYVSPVTYDYFADVAIDDVDDDVVSARVPQTLRDTLDEGADAQGTVVRVEASGEEWIVLEIIGQEPVATFTTGDIKMAAGVVPDSGTLINGGWLKCDGTAVSRAKYAALFRVILTNFGSGDGSTTFNIPDLRSRVPLGAGTYKGLAGTEGKIEANRGLGHTHDIDPTDHDGATNTTQGGTGDRVSHLNGTVGGSHAHGGTTGASNADPISHLAVHFLIKT